MNYPMLNSPTKDDAVGNAFYASVQRRMNWSDDFRDDSGESVSHTPPTSDPTQLTLLLAVHSISITLLRGALPQAGIGNVMPPSLAAGLAAENITAQKASKSTRDHENQSSRCSGTEDQGNRGRSKKAADRLSTIWFGVRPQRSTGDTPRYR